MIEKRPFAPSSGANHGWLNAKPPLLVRRVSRPQNMGWGDIPIWNDDENRAQLRLPPHGHANMEIVTYVRQGAITHRTRWQRVAHRRPARPGDERRLGHPHAEYNFSNPIPTRCFQILDLPRQDGGAPAWGGQAASEADRSAVHRPGSGFDNDNGALPIPADCRVAGRNAQSRRPVNGIQTWAPTATATSSRAARAVEVNGSNSTPATAPRSRNVRVLTGGGLEDSELGAGGCRLDVLDQPAATLPKITMAGRPFQPYIPAETVATLKKR